MIVTSNDLINLMYIAMTDNKMIEAINTLDLEQPVMTEEYETEKQISTSNKNITLVFKEINGYSKDGNPVLIKIDFKNYDFIGFPYNLISSGNYDMCCEKLGKKADYINKRRLQEAKIWVKSINNIDTGVVIHFTDTTFQTINYIIINKFEANRVGKNLIENKD